MAYTTIDNPGLFFNTVLYTGNGSTQSITGVGFQPDWTWIKDRSAAQNHMLFDAVRGVTKWLESNGTAAEQTYAPTLTAFDSDGFSLGNSGDVNGNSATFASWNWLGANGTASNTDGDITSTVSANTTAGFSIVTYTRTASGSDTIGHGLGVKPEIVLYKSRSSGSWYITTDIFDGSYDFLTLNSTNAKANVTGASAPTSTVFSNTLFGSSEDFVAYCFHSVKGYSKFGTYTGNGNADGTFVYTGFKPAFFLCKDTDNSNDWVMFDNKRDPHNVVAEYLRPNLNNTASSSTNYMDFTSNGIKHRVNDTWNNGSGRNYIYMAFAEAPFVTAGTKAAGTAR